MAAIGAARNGHLEVLQWRHVHKSQLFTTEAMNLAASSGHIEIAKWLHVNRNEGCTTKAMETVAYSGHRHIVEWVYKYRPNERDRERDKQWSLESRQVFFREGFGCRRHMKRPPYMDVEVCCGRISVESCW